MGARLGKAFKVLTLKCFLLGDGCIKVGWNAVYWLIHEGGGILLKAGRTHGPGLDRE